MAGVNPSDREHEIVRLWEQGFSAKRIAAQLGLTPGRVSDVIYRLNLNDRGYDTAHHQAMQFSSAELLRALQREGFA